MKHKIYYIAIVCCIAISCSDNQPKQEKEFDWTGKTINLVNSQEIIVPENPFITEIQFNILNDEYLFCRFSFYQDESLYAYKFKNDTLNYIGKVTQKGDGPLEMVGSSLMHQLPNKSLVLTTDGYNPKTFKLHENDFSKITKLDTWDLIKFPINDIGTMVERVLPLNDSRILIKAMGNVPAPFAYYNKGDSALTYFSYPDIETKSKTTNISQRTIMYAGKIIKHPTKDRFIRTCQIGTYACILDVKDQDIEFVNYIYNNPPEHILDKDGFNAHPKNSNKLGFTCIAATEKYIYMMKNDFTLDDLGVDDKNNGYPLWFNKQVYVFDWEGNPIKKYNLDKYISNFVVDSKDKYFYAQTMDPTDGNCSLVKYEL